MKKEIVVTSAIIALLSSLSAGNDFKVKEIKPGVDGKIIAPKDIAGKIDGNKKIGKGDEDKLNICGLGCGNLKPKQDMDKIPKNIGIRP